MKAGLSAWKADVVTIPSGKRLDTVCCFADLALTEQRAIPSKSKETNTVRLESGFARKSEIFMMFTSAYDLFITPAFAEVNSFQGLRVPISLYILSRNTGQLKTNRSAPSLGAIPSTIKIRLFAELCRIGLIASGNRSGYRSETGNCVGFSRRYFKDCQEPGDFQCLPQLRAEVGEHKPSAFGFCLLMYFDECAESSAVNKIDILKINDNPRGARQEQVVNRCAKPVALWSEHKTTLEYQKIDSIRFTLSYFQRHRVPPLALILEPTSSYIIPSSLVTPKCTNQSPTQAMH